MLSFIKTIFRYYSSDRENIFAKTIDKSPNLRYNDFCRLRKSSSRTKHLPFKNRLKDRSPFFTLLFGGVKT